MRSVWRQPFDGLDFRVDRRNLRLTGPASLASDLNGASAACSDTAPEFGAFHIQNVSENPEKGHFPWHVYGTRLPVHSNFVRHSISSVKGLKQNPFSVRWSVSLLARHVQDFKW